MNTRIENEFLILSNNRKIHIPTLELLLQNQMPQITQKGNNNIIVLSIGSKEIIVSDIYKQLDKLQKSYEE